MSDIVFKKIQPKSVIERDNDINANFQAIGKEIYKRAFVGIIGDGTSKEITVSHNLNADIVVDLWSNVAPYKNMLYNAEIVDSNNIKFTFDVAPSTDSLKVVVTSISTAYASPIFEARVKALEDEMPLKANLEYVDGKLVKKADLDYVNNKLALKADKSYTNTELIKKADKSVTDDLSLNKADKSDTYTRAELYNQTEINNFLDKKADKSNTYTRSELNHHIGNIEQKSNDNASDISNLNNRTVALEQKANDNTNDISNLNNITGALGQSISSNTQQISSNTQQISSNTQQIYNNKSTTDENKSEILKHDLALQSNAKDLLTHKDLIDSNANNILRKADNDYVNNLNARLVSENESLKAQLTNVKKVASTALMQTYNGEDIINNGELEIVGKADDGIIDVSEAVVNGEINLELKGKTFNNFIANGEIDRTFPTGGTITTDIVDYSSNLLPIGNYALMYNIISTGTVNTRNTPKITFDDNSSIYENTFTNYNITIGRKAWLFTTTKEIKELEWWGHTLDIPTVANNFILVNLDQLGLATKITTKQQAIDYFNFIEGTANTLPKKILVTGKNLFNKNSNGITRGALNIDGTMISIENFYTTDFIKILNLTSYNIPFSSTARSKLYDKNKLPINTTSYNDLGRNVISDLVFTNTDNATYMRISYSDLTSVNLLQIEQGTVATTYEPYSETVAKVPVELRSVPSIADSFDVTTGVHTKNVGKHILTEDDIDTLYTNPVNVNYIFIKRNIDYLYYKGASNSDLLSYYFTGYSSKALVDDISNIGTVSRNNENYFILVVAKGTYTTLAQAKTALAGTVVYYQLKTPIITKYEPQPLLATKGSQIQIESFESKVVPNSDGTITFDYDIASVEHVYRYDNGLEVETTDYTFSGKTITINGITDLIVVSADVYLKNSTNATLVSQVAVDNLASSLDKIGYWGKLLAPSYPIEFLNSEWKTLSETFNSVVLENFEEVTLSDGNKALKYIGNKELLIDISGYIQVESTQRNAEVKVALLINGVLENNSITTQWCKNSGQIYSFVANYAPKLKKNDTLQVALNVSLSAVPFPTSITVDELKIKIHKFF